MDELTTVGRTPLPETTTRELFISYVDASEAK